MQNSILIFGILLAGQVSDTGDRYPNTPPAAPYTENNITDNNTAHTPPVVTPPASKDAPAGLTKVIRPAELLKSLSKPIAAENLAGEPLSLAVAIQGASSRSDQTRRVETYWGLSQAIAEYRLALLEVLELQTLLNGLSQPGQAWDIAKQAALARQRVATSEVRAAQFRLQKELSASNPGNDLAIPSDQPLCGAYETKFEQIFRGRNSAEAQQLSELLPLSFEHLIQCSTDATAARQWLITVSQQRSPQSDGSQLLKAYEQLARQRREFITSAYRYNSHIARYTELAVPQAVSAERLVAMLIPTPVGSKMDWRKSGIQRASAEESASQSGAEGSRTRTFAEPGREESRRQPVDEGKGERSIVVPPK